MSIRNLETSTEKSEAPKPPQPYKDIHGLRVSLELEERWNKSHPTGTISSGLHLYEIRYAKYRNCFAHANEKYHFFLTVEDYNEMCKAIVRGKARRIERGSLRFPRFVVTHRKMLFYVVWNPWMEQIITFLEAPSITEYNNRQKHRSLHSGGN